jgi:hypothetical protein
MTMYECSECKATIDAADNTAVITCHSCGAKFQNPNCASIKTPTTRNSSFNLGGKTLVFWGGMLLVIAFFCPWWGASISCDDTNNPFGDVASEDIDEEKTLDEVMEATLYHLDWYAANLSPQMLVRKIHKGLKDDELEARMEEYDLEMEAYHNSRDYSAPYPQRPGQSLKMRLMLFGWRAKPGQAGLVIGLLGILVGYLLSNKVVLRTWGYMIQLILSGLTLLLLAGLAVFLLMSPNKDLSIGSLEFAQGLWFGGFVAIVGVGLLLVGMFPDVMAFLRKLRDEN